MFHSPPQLMWDLTQPNPILTHVDMNLMRPNPHPTVMWQHMINVTYEFKYHRPTSHVSHVFYKKNLKIIQHII